MTPYGKQAVGEAWADAEKIAEAFSELFKRLPERKSMNLRSTSLI